MLIDCCTSQIEALESELSSLKSQVENVRLSLNKQQAAVSMHSSWVQSQLGSHGQLVETLESRSAALATAVKVGVLRPCGVATLTT